MAGLILAVEGGEAWGGDRPSSTIFISQGDVTESVRRSPFLGTIDP
ncbi:MAG: hypothetical protein AB4042_19970 [Leptolyngbyaceae cyanobacterium]